MRILRVLAAASTISLLALAAAAQSEVLTNADILALAAAGIGEDIVVGKIRSSNADFDVSAKALIELKKAGISDYVITLMLDKDAAKHPKGAPAAIPNSPSGPNEEPRKIESPRDAVRSAKTIALIKDSIQPSRQALEKELLKRTEWPGLNLTLERYRDNADLYVEIGFVHFSLITHRYVYRIYDRRTGAVLAAGETTSWGSLAENLARNIARSLHDLATN